MSGCSEKASADSNIFRTNINGGIIDISALPNCDDHSITNFDDGVEISAGYELLRFDNTPIEIVEECLKTSV